MTFWTQSSPVGFHTSWKTSCHTAASARFTVGTWLESESPASELYLLLPLCNKNSLFLVCYLDQRKNTIIVCTQIHTNIFSLCQIMTTNYIWTLKTFILLILSFFFPFLKDFLAVSLLVYISKYLCWSVWVVFMLTKRNYIATYST